MLIRLVRDDELDALYAFVGERNVPGRQLCLHLTDVPSAVAADFGELDAPLVERCLVAVGDAGLEGAVAWDLGGQAGDRCWLFGPWVARDDDRAGYAALLSAALARVEARRVDNYVDAAFELGGDAHRAAGFARRAVVHVLRAEGDAPAIAAPPGVTIEGVEARWLDALTALHDAAFPDTHTSMSAMAGAEPDAARLLVAHAGDRALGYIYLTVGADGGTVEYIAVAPDARGRGVGRALLSAGLGWLRGRVAVTHLTVHADNARALGVYVAAGFAPHRSGVSWALTARS